MDSDTQEAYEGISTTVGTRENGIDCSNDKNNKQTKNKTKPSRDPATVQARHVPNCPKLWFVPDELGPMLT